MMEALHHKQFPANGVMGLIQCRAHRWHLRVGAYRIPTRFLGLKPAPHTLAMVRANGRGDVVGKVTESLAQRENAQAERCLSLGAPGAARAVPHPAAPVPTAQKLAGAC